MKMVNELYMSTKFVTLVPGNCSTYNTNSNPKTNISMSQNIRQKKAEKFYVDNDDKYMRRNIPELYSFFC